MRENSNRKKFFAQAATELAVFGAILLFLIAAGLWLAGIVMLLAVFDAFVVSWGVR